MKLLKPIWVSHGPLSKDSSVGRPIYSLDMHPDGSRLATGGLVDSCGVVVLWNMVPIRDPKMEENANIPRKLFQMDSHQACVNCVRWSPSGRWLASAGMDKVIMLWKKTSTASRQTTVFGLKERTTFTEHWRCASVLRGHTGDIIDLAWSQDGYRLASAGVDNNVIVWAHQTSVNASGACPFTMLTTLKGNQGFVKGLAWDPIGRYLASQGDEISVKIWRTSDWKEEAVIKKPFSKAVGQSQVMRMSWSLDGSTLAAPHAINNGFPTAKLIDRTNWVSAFDLVGHRKHVICARYCPSLFHKSVNGVSQDLACLALGSKDRSLSVWTTADRRALVVIHDLFTNSICDLTWNSNGTELMACSLDGTVSYMQFTSAELGTPWSTKDLVHLHHKSYGQSLLDSLVSDQATLVVPCRIMAGSTDQADIVLETPEALALQQSQADVCQRLREASQNSSCQNPRLAPQGPSKQIETRGKDGRRRIIPKFLGYLDSMDDDGCSNPQFQSSPSSQQDKSVTNSDIPSSSKVCVKPTEQPAAVTGSTKLNDSLNQNGSTLITAPRSISQSNTSTSVPPSPSKPAISTPEVTASPPCLTVAIKSLSVPLKDPPSVDTVVQTKRPVADPDNKTIVIVDSPGDDGVGSKLSAFSKQKKRRRVRLFDDNEEKNLGDKKGHSQNRSGPVGQSEVAAVSASSRSKSAAGAESEFCSQNSSSVREERCTGDVLATSGPVTLIPPQLVNETKKQFVCSHPVDGPILVELCGRAAALPAPSVTRQTNSQQDTSNLCRILAYRNDRTLWELPIEQKITSYAHTDHVICVGDTSGRIQLISLNGSRICSPMLLDSAVHRLSIRPLYERIYTRPPVETAVNNSTTSGLSRLHSVVSGRDVQESIMTRQSNGEQPMRSVQLRLIALCQSGRLCVWNIAYPSTACLPHSVLFSDPLFPQLMLETHVAEVIKGGPLSPFGFSSLDFTLDGYPIIHRRDGSSYMFHMECRTWLELFDASSKVRCMAAQKTFPSCPSGPLASYQMLHKVQGSTSSVNGDSLKTDNLPAEQRVIVQRFLEDQTHNAKLFGSAGEFRYWFTQWFRNLIENNLEDQIRNVCHDLIGPVYSTARTSWQPTIKGISKHELLKDLLSLFALNLRLQRLYVETKETLEQSESPLGSNL